MGNGGARRVLYAASTFGHLRNFHVPYLEALLDEGCTVTALGSGDPEGLPAGVACVDLPFTKSFTSPGNVRAAREAARIIRREGVDTVLVHTSLAAFFVRLGVLWSGRRADVRVVNTVQGYLFDDDTPFAKRGVLLAAEKLVAGATDLVVTLNRQDSELARRYSLSGGRVEQICGMGVDTGLCHAADAAEKRAARAALGVPDDAFALLYAAEFSERKNQAALIDALPALPGRCVLLLPGYGDRYDACRARARTLGVEGRVIMPGHRRDLAVWRAAADACASTSRSEGLPFHMVEAMACGLPVVASRVKGHEDLVVEGTSGLLFPFGDRGALAACVARLAGDPGLCSRMGAAGRAGVGPYELARVMPHLMRLYLGRD